jgi:CheY-like chemotaxis protein
MSHDGDIRVTSNPNKGTTFTLYFPALPTTQTEEPDDTTPPLIHGNGEVILVVEDDNATRTVLTESLNLLDYQVLSAQNGKIALSILEQGDTKVDLVLSDVVMPVMGGIDLLRTIQERGLADKVILLTGHPLKEKLEDLHTPILVTWMLKPPPLEFLAETIAQALHPQEVE